MFDVGFSEMLVVGLIALLVFGPERLPRVAKEAALWIRKARSMAASVKQEIDRELQLQDLKESMDRKKRDMDLMLLGEDRLSQSTPEARDKPSDKHADGEIHE